MKIELFTIVLILKTFLLSQKGVYGGPPLYGPSCKKDADCDQDESEQVACFRKYADYLDPSYCVYESYGSYYGFTRNYN
jgi:hypothetical protein